MQQEQRGSFDAQQQGRTMGGGIASQMKEKAQEATAQAAARGGVRGMEGTTTKAMEHFSSQIPSGAYLSMAIAAMAGSALLQMTGRHRTSLFVGQWVPTILIMGLYNKLVKIQGSE